MEKMINPEQKRCEDFLNMAVHELKTPIAVLKAYLQLMMKRLDMDKLDSYLSLTEKMDVQLDRLLSLISDLPDGARANAEEIYCLMSDCDINKLLISCVEGLSFTHSECNIILDLAKSSPVIPVDHQRIEQVIQNLVTNAIKYAGTDKSITVKSKLEPHHLYISVSDKGPGIPEQLRLKIFDKFYRIKAKQSNQPSGLGLGLHICQEIIFKHNGTIGVESKEGFGSEFWFRLPLFKDISDTAY